jgi:hypothetical protein
MVMRLTTTALVISVIVLAASSALFRVYTAPDRIQQRLETARQVCDKAGGLWTVDERKAPICKRD